MVVRIVVIESAGFDWRSTWKSGMEIWIHSLSVQFSDRDARRILDVSAHDTRVTR